MTRAVESEPRCQGRDDQTFFSRGGAGWNVFEAVEPEACTAGGQRGHAPPKISSFILSLSASILVRSRKSRSHRENCAFFSFFGSWPPQKKAVRAPALGLRKAALDPAVFDVVLGIEI